MLDPAESSMATSAHSRTSPHGQIAPLMMLASVTAAVRAGTLAALTPGLMATRVEIGTWLTLALYIVGTLVTVAVILVQSRIGLLMVVLYTSHSTTVLALDTPNGALSSVIRIVGGLTLLMALASPLRVRQKWNLLWPAWTVLLGVIVRFAVLSVLH